MPQRMNSCSCVPSPEPNSTRPFDRWSSVATSCASRIGLWNGSCQIIAPTWMRSVAAATAVRKTVGAVIAPMYEAWCSMIQ